MITNVTLSNEERKEIIRLGLVMDRVDWFNERGAFKMQAAVRWLVTLGLEAAQKNLK